MGAPGTTSGPWSVVIEADCDSEQADIYVCHPGTECDVTVVCTMGRSAKVSPDTKLADAAQMRASGDLYDALQTLAELFALDGENSMDRFERLASMFRRDTGYLAPGKDQPMGGADQPDGEELRTIYDGWFAGKVTTARAALARARTLTDEGSGA